MNVSTTRIRIVPWLAVLAVAASIALACAPASGGVGSDVGDAVPPFAMQLADGAQVSSETLDAADRPAHLFFFATWWPTCRAELQTLHTLAAEYEDINFYVVSYDEPLAVVSDYIASRGFTELISVQGVGDMMADLEVTRQAEMMAINGDSIMYHRQVIGDLTEWRSHLDALAADPAAVPSGFESDRQKDQRRQDLQLPSWWG